MGSFQLPDGYPMLEDVLEEDRGSGHTYYQCRKCEHWWYYGAMAVRTAWIVCPRCLMAGDSSLFKLAADCCGEEESPTPLGPADFGPDAKGMREKHAELRRLARHVLPERLAPPSRALLLEHALEAMSATGSGEEGFLELVSNMPMTEQLEQRLVMFGYSDITAELIHAEAEARAESLFNELSDLEHQSLQLGYIIGRNQPPPGWATVAIQQLGLGPVGVEAEGQRRIALLARMLPTLWLTIGRWRAIYRAGGTLTDQEDELLRLGVELWEVCHGKW